VSNEKIAQDAYLFEYIREFLRSPAYWIRGHDLKLFSGAGDSVALAILRVLYPDWNLGSGRIRKMVVAVRASLESPESISNEHDRIPAVSICLLTELMRRAELEEDRRLIERVAGEIKSGQFASSPLFGGTAGT
jgi:hypothetical protein